MLVLAVEGDERSAEVAQLADGGRAAVEVGARAPVGAHAAGEHHLAGIRREALAELARAGCSGRSKTPSTYASAAPGRTIPGRERPPSSRSSAWASTVLPAPVSPVSTFKPRRQAQLRPLDQQEVLDAKLAQHASQV